MSTRPVEDLLEQQLEVAALSGEVEGVMRGIVDRLMQLPGADGAAFSTIEGDEAHFVVAVGADAPLHGRRMPFAETLGPACGDHREPLVLRATDDTEVPGSLTPGARAVLLAPIAYDGRTHGILGVRSTDIGAFDTAAVAGARLFVRSAAIALRNAEVVERLVASEESYRQLHTQASDAMLVSDSAGTILEANDAAAALFWFSPDELAGMSIDELVRTGDRERAPLRRDELAHVHELHGESGFIRKDGTPLELEFASRVLDDGRVHTALRDVTQRKLSDRRLRASLERLREILRTQQEISALELEPATVTQAIVERTQRLAGADGAAVLWLDGDDFVYRYATGIAADAVGLRLRRSEGLSGVALAQHETIYCADVHADDRVSPIATKRIDARSLILAPIGGDGVLAVHARAPGAFDELAVETTRLMAEFVGSVVRNATELETRRVLVEELRSQGQVVEHMQTALWIWALQGDGDLVLEHANAASESATTLPVASVVGKSIREVMPDLSDEILTGLRDVVATQRLVDWGEVSYGDDRIPPSIFSMKTFPLSGGRVAVTFDNVTAVALAHRALEESESRFRGAFGSASVGMALLNLDGTFDQVNARLAQMLGYSVDELGGLTLQALTHPDDLDASFIADLLDGTRAEATDEVRYVRKDGSAMWAQASVAAVRSYDGTPRHLVALIHDITERHEAESLFTAIFERSVVPKLIADDDRRLVDVNAGALELLGVSAAEAAQLRIDDLFHDEDVEAIWRQFLQHGRLDAETTLHRPGGGVRRIEFVATANVRPGRHIAVVRDLTRQKELEAQLRQAQKMEAVGRLAGGIAHDFNNLLTAISGYSEFLASGIEDPRLKRHAEEIRKAAARAAALTSQLLAFSRRQVLQPVVLDLNGVVSDMDSLLRRLIGEDVELVTLLAPDLGHVEADPTQIEQVIVNLAVNARDAMPHGGSVTIETANVETEQGSFVALQLTDTGVGMTEDERSQLFDPFFTTKDGGTGLGLATVHGIIEQSGGTIEVDSDPGLGSHFRILLPNVEAPVERPPTVEPAATPPPGSETILLVEDESVVRELVAEILETNGYSVLQAGDGPSALELLRRHPETVDLLVTDVVMPGMSGPEVAKAVTSMRPGTPVLYTSGYTDSQIGHHGVLEPGIAFLQKPFSAADLTRKVRSLFDEEVPAAAGRQD